MCFDNPCLTFNPRSVEVEGKRLDSIPDCWDPTYCETDPPEPVNKTAMYRRPQKGSLKHGDGQVVEYTCSNIRKLSSCVPAFLFSMLLIEIDFPFQRLDVVFVLEDVHKLRLHIFEV